MGQEELVPAKEERRGGIVLELDGNLSAVGDFGMGKDDVFLLIGVVNELYLKSRNVVLHLDFRFYDIPPNALCMRHIAELGVPIPVGIFNAQGRLGDVFPALGRVGHGAVAIIRSHPGIEIGILPGIRQLRPIMVGMQNPLPKGDQHHLGIVRRNRNHGLFDRRNGDDRLLLRRLDGLFAGRSAQRQDCQCGSHQYKYFFHYKITAK